MVTELELNRVNQIVDEIKDIICRTTGLLREEIEVDKKLIAFGLDSLLFLTVSKQISKKYNVQIPVDAFFTTLDTLHLLAEYVADITEEKFAVNKPEPLNEMPITSESALTSDYEFDENIAINHDYSSNIKIDFNKMIQVFDNQYHTFEKQNEILGIIAKSPARINTSANTVNTKADFSSGKESLKSVEYYVPYRKLEIKKEEVISESQLNYIRDTEQKVNSLTKLSKEQTQEFRNVYVSNRNTAGFRLLYKEMVYQIIAKQGHGAKISDIDGNQMIDLTMGFGVQMFGHAPQFVTNALRTELDYGMPLGPMGRLSGLVARLISELTGVERVFFTNTGTEADMFAVRIARAVTGKSKIVCFKGAFHGTYDGVLGIPIPSDDPDCNTISLAPGITDNAVKDLIILDYDSDASLEYIKEHADIIAAVLTEPVQSRRPDIQPGEFLKKLRTVTEKCNIALIFDEIITGFRICAGGAQEYFGIEADIVTYGKVIGGGMPIGVLAGKGKYLDSIDGGIWNFGDESVPSFTDKRTFVAGTFCHHPLAMSAAHATLSYIRENKDKIYDPLNQKTKKMVNELNEFFQKENVSIHINYFGSLFRFDINFDKEIFYYSLLGKGIYIWEGRNCFLSTEHTDEDIQYIIEAVKKTVHEMKKAGFY